MKKHAFHIFLGFFFLFIWGAVFNKFFKKETVLQKEETPLFTFNNNFSRAKDTFHLELTNLNPFQLKRTRPTSFKRKQSLHKKTIAKKTTTKKHTFQYFGYVKAKSSASKLVLLKVDHVLYRKREKDKIETITILKAFSDSLRIKEGRVIKMIHKQ